MPATGGSAPSHAVQCMEIVGGNAARREHLRGVGLEMWVDSRPLGGGAGGDIHYFSMCGGGHVTRLVIADVAGHGAVVDDAARRLRRLMRKYINTLDQTRLARTLNDEFGAGTEDGRFATALLVTYFAPTRHLILCNAGHPRPLWYRRGEGTWGWLDAESSDAGSLRRSKARYHLERVRNLPLGILSPTDYEQFAVELGVGDLVVIYTDAWTEARNPAGAMLGEVGLLDFVRRIDPAGPDEVGSGLTAALDAWRGGAVPEDDQTLVVIEHVGGGVPPLTFGVAVRSLLKMLGVLRV
ncbi:MAG TPA: PP2C family protein-serine/threonine phosphatase [Planctomycetaceae bacterium]